MKRIGILGGTGAIGSRTVEILKESYPLLISYYSRPKASERNCKYVRVDIAKKEEIERFCQECDIIVNCAGASYLNGEKVARIAGQLGKPYIDPSGETFLEEQIADISKMGIFVLSSGFFPGMSGLLMRYLCESFDQPETILGLSASNEVPSQSAIEDFILTNLSGFGVALHYYEKGRLIRDNTEIVEIINKRPFKFQNYLTVEAERIAKYYSLKQANWYNASFKPEIVRKMQVAVVSAQNDKNSYRKLVEEVVSMTRADVGNSEQFTYMKIEGTGVSNGARHTKSVEVTSNCSSNMSAIIVAHTVIQIIEKNLSPGIYYAMDIINPRELLSKLSHYELQIKEKSIEKMDMEDKYEEGTI